MTPLAVARWVVLCGPRKVTPGTDHHLYLTEDGAVREDKAGEEPPEIFPWDQIVSVSLADDAGVKAAALAYELENGKP
jgi:hypothetical protein